MGLKSCCETKITLLNIDCMEYMATQPDNAFGLAIVDPPFFPGPNKEDYYCNFSVNINKPAHKQKKYKPLKNWSIPSMAYYNQLSRVSKHQIIWGINYFPEFIGLVGSGRIFWDKKNDKSTFSKGEIASCSQIDTTQMFRYMWNGFIREEKVSTIHPTQKPVRLYDWLLTNYAKPGQRILDTHLGSGSSAIAAHYFGVEFVGCEIDKDYYDAAVNRVNEQTRQRKLFP